MTAGVPVRLMPDAEEVLVTYLADLFPDAQVVTELYMGFEEEVPVVRVARIGGAQVRPLVLDGPRMDVDVYHRTRADASLLARRIAAAIPAMQGQAFAGGLVTSTAEEIGPSWRPEYNPQLYHFGATFVLTIRPTE